MNRDEDNPKKTGFATPTCHIFWALGSLIATHSSVQIPAAPAVIESLAPRAPRTIALPRIATARDSSEKFGDRGKPRPPQSLTRPDFR
jgi:hypothetical protein